MEPLGDEVDIGRKEDDGYCGIKASFDPLTLCLEVLGEKAPTNDSELAVLAQNPTVFHELVHSWQLFAFTSGFLTAAIRPVQSILLPELLHRHCKSISKPIVRTFEEEAGGSAAYRVKRIHWKADSTESTALFAAHKYYFDFEKLNAILDDPKRFSKDEARFSRSVSTGSGLLRWL
jgi:hypothetical protein